MKNKKYLIVGGVAGGATTASRLRRLDENAEIILFERSEYISYANCGLPYYIGNIIRERNKLLVQTAEKFSKRFNVDVRTCHEVLSIDPDRHTISVKDLDTGDTYQEIYNKLVLSPGAAPICPSLPGIKSKRIFTLRSIPDMDKIKTIVSNSSTRHTVVIGGGFIGLEMAENFKENGLQVTVVEMSNQVMAPLDYSMASFVHQHVREKQVELILEDGVKRFKEKKDGLIVYLKSGKAIETDLVLISIGVNPEIKLAADAGLTIGQTGGIKVNSWLQTSDPDIYALGDAIEVIQAVTGKPARIPLAGPANKQGRIVADNIVSGNTEHYPGTIGTCIAKIFDLTVAATGVNTKSLKHDNIPYLSSFTHSQSHAGYYPGAKDLSVKVIFEPVSGRLLGAQIVGYEGVDKRIDVFAKIIQDKGTIKDLVSFEHAYASPFSSAKDPVNMAGHVAENILTGKMRTIHWRDINLKDPDIFLLDVRKKEEYESGTISGAVNIPLDELRERLSEIPEDRKIILFCAIGMRGYLAYRILSQQGFKEVYNLKGGYKIWSITNNQPLTD